MLEFRNIELSDKNMADKHLAFSDYRGCEYSFGNNYIWRNVYDMKICDRKEFYLIENKYGFMYPAGDIDIRAVVKELKDYTAGQNKPLVFSSMNKAKMELLAEIYGDSITITSNRDFFDYIYTFEALSTLKGKKLHSKRNHINRFRENNWSYETIDMNNIEECKEMSTKWREVNNDGNNRELELEVCAVKCGLDNFNALAFKGGLLRIDGEIQAFTFGEHLNSDTFVVHAEKAFTDYQGCYPAMSFEFLNHECKGYTYINREEDTGEENLRKAKLSYKPIFMEEKFRVVFK